MDTFTIPRLLRLPDHSFFLFGPRGVGKSTWLRENLPDAKIFDLLESRTFLELARDPGLLEAKIGPLRQGSWVWIDEVQKVPALLDEVHRLIEKHRWKFALSGSSARKLKRGGANLLGGRAITRHLESFSFAELGERFDLKKAIEWGSLPLVVLHPKDASDTLTAFVHTYLKEEIQEEGLVRRLEPFVRFLEIAGILNGQVINGANIARDAKVPRANVDVYFDILEDTLLGYRLPAYRPQAKVRERALPKFYWCDPGIARGAAGLLNDTPDSVWLGSALETLIFHELRVYNHTQKKERLISYYRTGADVEIDFVVELEKRTTNRKPAVVCLEIKSSRKWNTKWNRSLRSLSQSEKVRVKGMYGIYSGKESLKFEDISVLPIEVFLKKLYEGEIF